MVSEKVFSSLSVTVKQLESLSYLVNPLMNLTNQEPFKKYFKLEEGKLTHPIPGIFILIFIFPYLEKNKL